jgi:hypothetical protein
MLRLPDIRHHLVGITSETLGEMFEAYDLAVDALDRFRTQHPGEEYEQLCLEIEREVLVYCADR